MALKSHAIFLSRWCFERPAAANLKRSQKYGGFANRRSSLTSAYFQRIIKWRWSRFAGDFAKFAGSDLSARGMSGVARGRFSGVPDPGAD